MSTTTVDVERIESLEAQVKALEKAFAAGRKIRILLFVALLALMALIIFLFKSLYDKAASPEFQAELTELAQTAFEEDQDRYMNDVKTLVDEASPVISQAFYAQTKEDMPKYTAAIDKERDLFLKDLQSKLDVTLQDQYGELLNNYEAKLVTEFPKLKDDDFKEKVMKSLDKAVGEAAARYYTEELGTTIGFLYEDWDSFPPAEAAKSEGPTLGDQLIGTLLELLSHRMAQSG